MAFLSKPAARHFNSGDDCPECRSVQTCATATDDFCDAGNLFCYEVVTNLGAVESAVGLLKGCARSCTASDTATYYSRCCRHHRCNGATTATTVVTATTITTCTALLLLLASGVIVD
ncbi:unnamed protein product [Lampetra planeri]